MSCLRCSKKVKKHLSLICDHIMCYPCGSLSLELDTLKSVFVLFSERQKKYKLRCPKCKKITYTYDLENLIVKEQDILSTLKLEQSLIEFTSMTSRQKNTWVIPSKKNSFIEAKGPMVTQCNNNQQQYQLNTPSSLSNRQDLLKVVQNSKEKLQNQYSALSQNITDQFYQFNRLLTKHRQSLLLQLQSHYVKQINCLQTYAITLSQPYTIPAQLDKIQKILSEIKFQTFKIHKTNQQSIDSFLKKQIFISSLNQVNEDFFESCRLSLPLNQNKSYHRGKGGIMKQVKEKGVIVKQKQNRSGWKK